MTTPASVQCSCQVASCGDTGCRLVIAGEVDLATAPEVLGFLDRHLAEASAHGDVVIDMSQVRFFSAAGLRVLLTAAEHARARQVTLRLHPVSPAVELILDLCDGRQEFIADDSAR